MPRHHASRDQGPSQRQLRVGELLRHAISDILTQQSMARSRWVVLDQQLRPLDQQVIHANPQAAERIVGELADRYAAGSESSA